MAKVVKFWIASLLVCIFGTFIGGFGVVILEKVIEVSEMNWMTVLKYCLFMVSGILLLVVLWIMYVSIEKSIQNLREKKIRALDVRTKKMTVEYLLFMELMLRQFDKKELSDKERINRVAQQLGKKITMTAQEAQILVKEGHAHMQETLELL